MKGLLLAVAFSAQVVTAKDLVVVNGGVSPDGRLAVAVVPQKKDQLVDEADGNVYLIDNKTKRIIGPFEEVDSTGGAWGTTTTNVRARWSPDGRGLVINFRTGRLMGGYQLYRMSGRRAVPINLPDASKHPKGKILDVLTTTANPGAELRWEANGTLVKYAWGFAPKPGHFDDDFSKYGLGDFEGVGGSLEFVYRFTAEGKCVLEDVRTPKDK